MSTVIEVPRAELLERVTAETWVRGWGDADGDGPTCLHGHIRRCSLLPGDSYIVQQVYDRRGEGSMVWNDYQPNVEAVRMWVRTAGLDIGDRELADVFGPQWEPIVGLVRRAALLTPDQETAIRDARAVDGDAPRGHARQAAWQAASSSGRASAEGSAVTAAGGAAGRAPLGAVDPWGAGWRAARDAATGLVVADLVGEHGLEQTHIETLLTPWTTVCGDPRQVQP